MATKAEGLIHDLTVQVAVLRERVDDLLRGTGALSGIPVQLNGTELLLVQLKAEVQETRSLATRLALVEQSLVELRETRRRGEDRRWTLSMNLVVALIGFAGGVFGVVLASLLGVNR